MIQVSVSVPVYNGEKYIGECLNALLNQSLPRDQYEVIVIDDGSTDATLDIIRQFKVRLITQTHRHEAAARNAGWRAANGKWIAFTDSDAVPSRVWLQSLLSAVKSDQDLGAAGRIIAFPSEAPAARFVTIANGLNTETHLNHPVFPYAPMSNVLYRRAALEAGNGFDERYDAYLAPDLHTRLTRQVGGEFHYAPRAIILHHHRETWREYWRQQRNYGRGYAQLMLHYPDQLAWPIGREIKAWLKLIGTTLKVGWPIGSADERLLRRGLFVRDLAQRLGFRQTYYNRSERTKWS
jgi:glycosyltransferase involved in cell wall biosynthesis